MATDDLERIQGIRNDKLQRLSLLRRRQAIEGFRVDPSVIIEIEQTKRELEPLDYALSNPGSVNTAEEIGAGARYLALDRKMDLIVKFMDERMDRMEENNADWREAERQDRKEGQATYRLLITLALLMASAAFVIALAVLLVR